MSNVLIGIVAVLLFVFLALAGAYYLGPRFAEAQSGSQAMQVTQMASQVMQACSMYRAEASVPVVARTPAVYLQTQGFLKALPLNPMMDQGGWPFRVLYSGDLLNSGFYADMIFMSLGPEQEARKLCESVNRQTQHDPNVPDLPLEAGSNVSSMISGTIGCFRMHPVGIPGEANPGDYIVYTKL